VQVRGLQNGQRRRGRLRATGVVLLSSLPPQAASNAAQPTAVSTWRRCCNAEKKPPERSFAPGKSKSCMVDPAC
jgi:hypothetical protein